EEVKKLQRNYEEIKVFTLTNSTSFERDSLSTNSTEIFILLTTRSTEIFRKSCYENYCNRLYLSLIPI
ncbi:unnamed protein product, partial [Larinioides sclopetarius]